MERISKANSENAKKRFTSNAKPTKPTATDPASAPVPNPHEELEALLDNSTPAAASFDDLAVDTYGINGLVTLSGTDYNELLADYGQAKLDKGIQEVDYWLSTLDSNNVRDYAKQVRTAIERNWNRVPGNHSKRTATQNAFSSDTPPDSVHEEDFLKGVVQNEC